MAEETRAAIDIEVGDYDEVEADANRKLAPGNYVVRVKDIPEVRYARETNNAYLAWQLETMDCEDPDDNGFTLFYNTPVQGKGRNIFFRFAEAFGRKWEGSRITDDFLQEFVGEEAEAVVAIRTFEGRESNEIKAVRPNSP